MAEKSPKHGKSVSKIRREWLICISESDQEEKNAGLRRQTAGVMLSESAEL